MFTHSHSQPISTHVSFELDLCDLWLLFYVVNPGFSQCRVTSLIFSQAVNTTAGTDLLWSASITNPERQRYCPGFGWSYVSRTIILNETAFNPSACGLRDAWQIRPSEGLLLTLIYGSASFPLPVMLCVEPLSVCFTWCNVSPAER